MAKLKIKVESVHGRIVRGTITPDGKGPYGQIQFQLKDGDTEIDQFQFGKTYDVDISLAEGEELDEVEAPEETAGTAVKIADGEEGVKPGTMLPGDTPIPQ